MSDSRHKATSSARPAWIWLFRLILKCRQIVCVIAVFAIPRARMIIIAMASMVVKGTARNWHLDLQDLPNLIGRANVYRQAETPVRLIVDEGRTLVTERTCLLDLEMTKQARFHRISARVLEALRLLREKQNLPNECKAAEPPPDAAHPRL